MSYGYKNFQDENLEQGFANNQTNQINSSAKANIEEYDRFSIPPNISICEMHLNANKIGEVDKTKRELCPCCTNLVNKKGFGPCESTQRISYMGPGYPLFFLFMKCCTVIIASMLVIFGIYAIYSNNNGGACYDENYSSRCYASYATLYSYWNAALIDKRVVANQQYLCLGVMFCLVILLQIMRYMIRKTSIECDERDVSASDYTLMVENIPINPDVDYVSELKTLFESCSTPESPSIVVEKINLAYSIKDYPNLLAKQNEAVKKKSTAYATLYKTGNFADGVSAKSLDDDIKQCQNAITTYTTSFSGENRNLFAGVAFISLRTEKMKKDMIKNYKISSYQRFRLAFRDYLGKQTIKVGGLIFRNCRLFIKEAAEPGDIYWANLGLRDRERYLRQLLGASISFIILVGCVIVIYFFTVYEDELAESDTSSTSSLVLVNILTVVLSIAIVMINKGLSALMPKVVAYEKNSTLSQDYASVVRKLALALFLNSGLISFLVSTIYLDLYYAEDGGMISTVMTVIIMNTILYSVMNFVNPGYISLWWTRRKYRKDASKWAVTQDEANKLWENPTFRIDTISANMINVLQIAAFFSPLIPLSLVFTLIFFISNYWIYKHALYTKSTISVELGNDLTEQMTNMLDLCILFFAAGVFIFNAVLATPGITTTTIVILFIGIVHWLIPGQKINKILFQIEEFIESKEYSQVVEGFDNDYDRSNPVTLITSRKEKLKKSKAPR